MKVMPAESNVDVIVTWRTIEEKSFKITLDPEKVSDVTRLEKVVVELQQQLEELKKKGTFSQAITGHDKCSDSTK